MSAGSVWVAGADGKQQLVDPVDRAVRRAERRAGGAIPRPETIAEHSIREVLEAWTEATNREVDRARQDETRTREWREAEITKAETAFREAVQSLDREITDHASKLEAAASWRYAPKLDQAGELRRANAVKRLELAAETASKPTDFSDLATSLLAGDQAEAAAVVDFGAALVAKHGNGRPVAINEPSWAQAKTRIERAVAEHVEASKPATIRAAERQRDAFAEERRDGDLFRRGNHMLRELAGMPRIGSR